MIAKRKKFGKDITKHKKVISPPRDDTDDASLDESQDSAIEGASDDVAEVPESAHPSDDALTEIGNALSSSPDAVSLDSLGTEDTSEDATSRPQLRRLWVKDNERRAVLFPSGKAYLVDVHKLKDGSRWRCTGESCELCAAGYLPSRWALLLSVDLLDAEPVIVEVNRPPKGRTPERSSLLAGLSAILALPDLQHRKVFIQNLGSFRYRITSEALPVLDDVQQAAVEELLVLVQQPTFDPRDIYQAPTEMELDDLREDLERRKATLGR